MGNVWWGGGGGGGGVKFEYVREGERVSEGGGLLVFNVNCTRNWAGIQSPHR